MKHFYLCLLFLGFSGASVIGSNSHLVGTNSQTAQLSQVSVRNGNILDIAAALQRLGVRCGVILPSADYLKNPQTSIRVGPSELGERITLNVSNVTVNVALEQALSMFQMEDWTWRRTPENFIVLIPKNNPAEFLFESFGRFSASGWPNQLISIMSTRVKGTAIEYMGTALRSPEGVETWSLTWGKRQEVLLDEATPIKVLDQILSGNVNFLWVYQNGRLTFRDATLGHNPIFAPQPVVSPNSIQSFEWQGSI